MPRCSFCRKSADQVRRLIAGPRAFICDACVDLCNDILARHPPELVEARGVGARPRGRRRWWRRLLGWWSVTSPTVA
jgi:hypothetical protein